MRDEGWEITIFMVSGEQLRTIMMSDEVEELRTSLRTNGFSGTWHITRDANKMFNLVQLNQITHIQAVRR